VFAPKTAKPQSKSTEESASRRTSHRSTLAPHQLGHDPIRHMQVLPPTIGNQAALRILARGNMAVSGSGVKDGEEHEIAGERASTDTARGSVSWDSSKIRPQASPPAEPSGAQTVSLTLPIQAKLEIGASERDGAAANHGSGLTKIPRWATAPTLQRACNCGDGTCQCEGEGLTRSHVDREGPALAPPSVFDVLRSTGEPLDADTRRWFEPRLGMDLGHVQVHHDTPQATSTAREVRASAYTVGQHIVFADGKYAPSSPTGREVLAHELSHVAQQRDDALPSGPLRVSRPSDPDEVTAHETAHALAAGQPVSPGAAIAYGPNGCVPGVPGGSAGSTATPQLSRTSEATPVTQPPQAPHLARYPDPPAAVSIPSPLPSATTATSPTVSTTRPEGSAIPGGWTTGASGPNAAPSRIGTVERVPIEGLPGKQREQEKLPSGSPAESYPTSTATGPRMAEGAGRAVALVPEALRTGGPGPVDVLLHLHGLGGGMRRRTGDPTDVGEYEMPQQIQAFLASRSGERLIAIMPIGISVSPSQTTDKEGNVHWGFHNTSFGAIDPDTFIQVCFSRLAGSLPAGATPGRVILSAHSGGGLEISRMITETRLPKNFAGLFSFESIHGDLPTWIAFVLRHLDADLIELQRLRTGTPDPAMLLQAQQSYLTGSGFRFVAMARSSSDYGTRVRAVRAAIVDWFGRHASDLSTATAGQNSVQDLLWANYQAVAASTGTHEQALATAQHNLGRALATLPPPLAPPGAATSTTTTTGTPPPVAAPGVQRLARQIAPAGISATDAARLLTDASVAMGRADGTAGAPDPDHTTLRRDDISAAIAGRATNHDLDQAFTGGIAAITAASDADRPAVIQRWARAIRFVLENQFVHDPIRSGLDLLDPASAAHYRGFHWNPADYPGPPAGPNEGVARSMARAMATIVPERRPNIGVANVMTSAELTATARKNILANLVEVPGQPHQRLLAPAARAFDRMQTIAGTFDGINLSINNSFRSFTTAQANAAAAANPMAVASFSSHSLGLAVDFNLTAGAQHFTEVTTTPMQNVANMRSSPTYKWMALHGEEFGWYPFGDEPWHWEYNPPGFRDVFRSLVFPHLSATPSASPATGATAGPAS
jgi:Domain of unknown function (DUF4157)/D-alanyl-D-alanine carboxypeptidase